MLCKFAPIALLLTLASIALSINVSLIRIATAPATVERLAPAIIGGAFFVMAILAAAYGIGLAVLFTLEGNRPAKR